MMSSPSVDLILKLDADYRDKAVAGKLNPEGMAWLPVMHTVREGWRFTVLFSNTQRAHDLGRTNDWDWVVVYYDGGRREQKCTVVTEHEGPLAG